MNGVADLGTLVVRMSADNASFDAGMLKSMAVAAGIGTAIAATAAAVVASGAATQRAYMGFESAMTKALAIMSDSDRRLRASLEKTALDMSVTSVSSAEDLAKAYYYLASAGLDAERSMRALGVVQKFSVAGDMGLERASEALTDSVANLGLASKAADEYQHNMQRVADVLAKAGADSNASTEQLAVSLRTKAGAALRTFHKDVEEGVAVLMAFGNQGVKAENAGEQLNIVIRDLARASILNKQAWTDMGLSVFNSEGNFRNLADIFQDMELRLGGMSDEGKKAALMQLGFQDRTVSATNALLGMSGSIREFERSLRGAAGFQNEVADVQMSSTANQMTLLKNAAEALVIKIGQGFNPEIRAAVKMLQDLAKEADNSGSAVNSLSRFFALGIDSAVVFTTVVWNMPGLLLSALKLSTAGVKAFAYGLSDWMLYAADAFIDFREALMVAVESVPATVRVAFNSLIIVTKDKANEWLSDLSALGSALPDKFKFNIDFRFNTAETKKDLLYAMADIDKIEKNVAARFAPEREMVGAMHTIASEGEKAAMLEMETASLAATSAWDRMSDTLLKYVATVQDVRDEQEKLKESAKKMGMGLAPSERPTHMADYIKEQTYARLRILNDEGSKRMLVAGAVNSAFRAQSDTIVRLNEAYAEHIAKRKEYAQAVLAGTITLDEMAAALARNTLSANQWEAALSRTPLVSDVADSYRRNLLALNQYDDALQNSADAEARINKMHKDGLINDYQRNKLLQASTVSLDEYNRKRSEALAADNEFIGKNALVPGFDPRAGIGQAGWDFTMVRPTGVDEQDQMNALLSQEAALNDSYARRKAAIEEHYRFEVDKEEEKQRILKGMEENYNAKMNALEMQRTHMILGSAQSIGDSLSSIAADTAGKQSGFYKTMFAMSKAFAIADASVKIAQGIAAAAANPWPTNLAAMASVAAATASIVSNIMSVRMTSFEGGGLTPSGGRSGGLDGKGGFTAMLHPNEAVIDLEAPKNRGGALGGNQVSINIINNAGVAVETTTEDDGKKIQILLTKVIKQVASDISTGRGEIPRAMGQAYKLQRG